MKDRIELLLVIMLLSFVLIGCKDEIYSEHASQVPFSLGGSKEDSGQTQVTLNYMFDAEATEAQQLCIKSTNTRWQINNPASSWVHVSSTSGSSSANVLISVNNNTAFESRVAELALSSLEQEYPVRYSIKVSQAAVAPYLYVSESSVAFDKDRQEKTISVNSNVDWTCSCSADWLTAERSGDDIRILVEESTSGYRYSTINLEWGGNTYAIVKVSQTYIPVQYDSYNNTFVSGDHSYKMVYVEGGTFTMGATSEQGSEAEDDELITHRVTLSSYYIGQTEVPQWLWTAMMGSNPSKGQGDDLPVEYVSWDDCQTFMDKLNSLTGKKFALPTEAQWEFAARGGNSSNGYKYSGSNDLYTVAWFMDNGGYKSHNVGEKSANELGLYDMSGNVWEWCYDWYGDYPSSAQTNPTGPNGGSVRVFRGGSFTCPTISCRVSDRCGAYPFQYAVDIGLRLALCP